jgi:hypothetical protein
MILLFYIVDFVSSWVEVSVTRMGEVGRGEGALGK